MIRAAIAPCYAGYCAFAVAEDRHVIAVDSVEVGRLVPLDVPIPGKFDMRRALDPADLAAVVADVFGRVRAAGAEHVAIDWVEPSKEGPATQWRHRTQAVAQGLFDAFEAAGIPVEFVSPEVGMLRGLAGGVDRGFDDWPEDRRYRVCLRAGAVMLLNAGTWRRANSSHRRGGFEHVPTVASMGASPAQSPGPSPVEGISGGEQPSDGSGRTSNEERIGVAPSTTPTAPTMPRNDIVAGIDPGAGQLGIVIAQGSAAPLRLLFAATVEVGERVPLTKPRKVTRPDGSVYEVTTKHVLTDAHVDALAGWVVSKLVEFDASRLVIEHVDHVHFDGSKPSAASSMATAIARMAWLDGVIGERARATGVIVSRVSATSWRAVVAGRSSGVVGGSGAERIPAAVSAGFADWPAQSNDHVRDAAGLCLYLVAPPKVATTAARRGSGQPRKRSTSGGAYQANLARNREKTAEKRAAAGCVCGNARRGRHRRECPLGSVARQVRAAEEREAAGK